MRRTIKSYMAVHPYTVEPEQTMAAAHELMRQHRIRHLPVLKDGRLVGIVTERDLHLVETLKDVDPSTVTVDDAMTPEPYAVAPDTPIEEVCSTMARLRIGSVVIVERERVVGLFTTIDALHVLVELLEHQRKPG